MIRRLSGPGIEITGMPWWVCVSFVEVVYGDTNWLVSMN